MRLFKCLTRERGISEGQKGNSNSLCGPLIECGPLTVGAKKKDKERDRSFNKLRVVVSHSTTPRLSGNGRRPHIFFSNKGVGGTLHK